MGSGRPSNGSSGLWQADRQRSAALKDEALNEEAVPQAAFSPLGSGGEGVGGLSLEVAFGHPRGHRSWGLVDGFPESLSLVPRTGDARFREGDYILG